MKFNKAKQNLRKIYDILPLIIFLLAFFVLYSRINSKNEMREQALEKQKIEKEITEKLIESLNRKDYYGVDKYLLKLEEMGSNNQEISELRNTFEEIKEAFPKLNMDAERLDEYPDIWLMIISSPTLCDKDKEFWIRVLPAIHKDQVQKLYEILLSERSKNPKLYKDNIISHY